MDQFQEAKFNDRAMAKNLIEVDPLRCLRLPSEVSFDAWYVLSPENGILNAGEVFDPFSTELRY